MPRLDKQNILNYATTEEEKLTLAKVYDTYCFSKKSSISRFTSFLSPADRALCQIAFKDTSMMFYGGFSEAERTVLGFLEENEYAFPICVVKSEGDFSSVTHRDFLGSIMGLGITRECIGDIIIEDNSCYIFVLRKMAEYISENLLKVKKTNVKNSLCECFDVSVIKEFEYVNKSVASLRADGVVAAMFNLSRTEASESMKRGLVTHNHRILTDCDKKIKEGDTLSLRGKGKATLNCLKNLSKKGRLLIEIKKYK